MSSFTFLFSHLATKATKKLCYLTNVKGFLRGHFRKLVCPLVCCEIFWRKKNTLKPVYIELKNGKLSRSDFEYRGIESFETNVVCQTSDIK